MLVISPLIGRIASTALGVVFLLTAHPSLSFAQTKAAEGFQTLAPFAILIDAGSDTILFEKNADQLMEPASMSKLMTMEVVFQDLTEGRLKLDDEFTVSENAWRRGGAPSGGSAMFAPLRTQVKVSDLLQGVIVQSGNDACIVFAEGIAGSESAFALRMEKRARELGLIKSTFTNSTGLHDPNHRMTARELAKLAQHIIKTYPEYYKYYSQADFTFNKIRQQNRNPLLTAGIGADGLKTGFTKEAGYGVTASAVQNGLRLIVVVNGLKTGKDRADEARKLLEWGFRSFESRRLFAEGQVVGEAKVFGGAIGGVPLVGNGEIRVLVPRGSPDKMLAKIVYNGPVPAPIKQGQNVGRLKVWRGDHLALDVPLRANADVAVGSLPQRAFDAASEFAIGLFRLGTNRL